MTISGIPAYRPYITPDYSPVIAKIIATLDSQSAAMLQPAEGLRQASSSYDIQISSYGQIQSHLAVLESAAQSLSGSGAFSRYSAKSANPSAFTSYAQGGAQPGAYHIEVSQLAQGETLVSAAQQTPNISNPQAAILTFSFGNGTIINLNLEAMDSLSAIARHINQARIGISAQVISDNSGFRLMLNGASGTANAFSIAVSGNEAIRHLLSYSAGTADNAMTQTIAAQDSMVRVSGTPISDSNNVFTTGGITLYLKGVGAATVSVSPDLTRISDAVQLFVDAYNIAQSDIASNMAGLLSGDQTLSAIIGQLKSDLAARQSVQGGSSLLAQIGIKQEKDGALSFNTQAFRDAYALNPDGVARLFTDNGNGLADQIARQIHDVIQPNGDIPSTINELMLKIQKNQQTESNLQESAFQNLQYSAHQYAQQLSIMIIKHIMEYFLQFNPQQSNSYQTSLYSGAANSFTATMGLQLS